MEKKIDVNESIESAWRGMLDGRNNIQRNLSNDYAGQMRYTGYKELEQHAVNLQEDLNNLTETLMDDFNKKFKLSPSAEVDLRTTLVSAVSCSSQLGITAAFDMARLQNHCAPQDIEDYAYDAVADYNNDQETVINKIWEGVNN